VFAGVDEKSPYFVPGAVILTDVQQLDHELQKAKAAGKTVILSASKDPCGPCAVQASFLRGALKDPIFKDRIVVIKIFQEKEQSDELRTQLTKVAIEKGILQSSSTPDFGIVLPDGTPVSAGSSLSSLFSPDENVTRLKKELETIKAQTPPKPAEVKAKAEELGQAIQKIFTRQLLKLADFGRGEPVKDSAQKAVGFFTSGIIDSNSEVAGLHLLPAEEFRENYGSHAELKQLAAFAREAYGLPVLPDVASAGGSAADARPR
jgi:hypothetical protein